MSRIRSYGKNTFASLVVRNYRLYFIGQGVSISGTWMQTVAQGWLVLELTDSGVQLGLVLAAQFMPMLLLGPWGGVVVDRFDKRTLIFWTQSLFAALALSMGVLVLTGLVELWMVYAFVILFGLVRVFDQPARQTFVSEMVGPKHLRNAVSLLASENQLSRIVGPSLGGVLIAGVGIGFCFVFNALTYLALIAALSWMRAAELYKTKREPTKPGQLVEGLRYAWSVLSIRTTLLMMAAVGTLAYEFQTSLPLVAKYVFGGDAAAYAALLATMGVGAVVGGLYSAGRATTAPSTLIGAVALFGASTTLAALMPSLASTMLVMVVVGFFSINVTALGNTTVQLASAPEMRGRVMALWSTVMIGSTALGAPLVGFVGEHFGGRWSLGVGGISAVVAAGVTALMLREKGRRFAITSLVRMHSEEAIADLARRGK